MKKLIIGLLLMAGAGYCGQLTYTTAKTQALLNRVNETGWAYYSDSTYVSTNTLSISGTRTKIVNNGAGAFTNTNYLPATSGHLWSTTSNYIASGNMGNAFEVRLQFQCDPVGAGDDVFDIDFDIGGAETNVIASTSVVAPKGTSVFDVNLSMPLFSLGTFVTNGCSIYFDATHEGDSFDIYDITLMIKQDYFDN